MFFIVSKLFWLVASPVNLLLAGVFLGALFARARLARAIALVCAALLIAISILPVGVLLVRPLEQRFPPPPPDLAAPEGIIVLGGAIDDSQSWAHGQTEFDEGAARLTEAVILAKRFPLAKIIYTGGDGSMSRPGLSSGPGEADEGRRLLIALGVAPERIVVENRSRNTVENAQFTAALIHPEPSQTWLLDTSAYHMPRSMGLFEKAGFSVVAFPVDYRAFGDARDYHPAHDAPRNLRLFDLATHEWAGLVGYWLSGKIDHLFPAPAARKAR